jgi:NTE family protein
MGSIGAWSGIFMGIFKRSSVKIGLALGGGGARGLAHIGVLKVLERENIPVACIAGTSAGSIIAAMYCQLESAGDVEERIRNFVSGDRFREMTRRFSPAQKKDMSRQGWLDRTLTFVKRQYIVTRAFRQLGLLDRSGLESAIRALIVDEDIRDSKIPLAVVATDLWKGEDVVMTRGSLRRAVSASAGIPGTFPPLEMDGRCLVDGCVINMVPVHETRDLGADRVIAVDVTRELVRPPAFQNGLEVMFRADEITNYRLNEFHLEKADVVVRPKMGDTHWAEFTRLDELIRLGEEAAEEKLADIRRLLLPDRRRWFRFFRGGGN